MKTKSRLFSGKVKLSSVTRTVSTLSSYFSYQLAVLGARNARVGLHLREEDEPPVDAGDRSGVYPGMLLDGHRFDARRPATTVNARHGLASPARLVATPLLSHFSTAHYSESRAIIILVIDS